MKKVIMVHGWEGFPDEGWRPWLKAKLLEKGYHVEIPAMPDTKHPKVSTWVEHLRKTVTTPDEEVILIGHSLGVITILRYLESLKDDEKIGKSIFLAGFSTDLKYEGYEGELSEFFQPPVDFEKVKKHCSKFVVLHSEDDKWVPINHAYIFKDKLGAQTIIQNGMKHYSGDDGIIELPILLDLIG